MSTTIGRGASSDSQNDRSPLLGGVAGRTRDRGDLPYWRHVLENRMTWEWYKITLTTAATSLLLFNLPYQNRFTSILGAILYLVSSVIFLLTFAVHLVRFIARPTLLVSSLRGDESHHVPLFPSSFALLILSGAAYASHLGTHHSPTLRRFFWAFAALSTIFNLTSSLAAFAKTSERSPAREFTAQIILPLVLSGSVAATAISHTAPSGHHHGDALAILIIGAAIQGAGTLLSIMYLSNLLDLYHKSTYAAGKDRPALFIAASLPALSTLGALQLAQQALRHFPASKIPEGAVDVVAGASLYCVGAALGVLFWGLALWWFVVAVVANLADVDVRRSWFGGWDVVFGHVALVLANNELLRLAAFPRVLTVLNEVLGVATVGVFAAVVVLGVVRVSSGRVFRE